MNTQLKTTSLAILIAVSNSAWALSPPNITTDIPWGDAGGVDNNTLPHPSFNGVTDIALAFNNGRRQEESQLDLSPNSLGTLDLPSQATWDLMTDDAKALLIINEERQDRAGMQLGVIGLPLAGIESHMDNISKNYGDLLHDTDTFSHSQPSGNGNTDSPFIRIDNDPDIGSGPNCHEFITRAENLASFVTTGNSIPLPLERALYGFIYDDADSAWGHREALLLQDVAFHDTIQKNNWGFSNNHASPTSEGFLGIYVRSSADYNPFSNFPSAAYGSIVVMNIFDPVSSPTDCHYNATLDHTQTTSSKGQVPTFTVANNQWTQIGLNTAAATGSSVSDIIADDMTGTYDTDWVVYSYRMDTGAYQKLNLTDVLLPGVGYWLLQTTGASVTIDMPSSSSPVYATYTPACTSTEGCFEIPLQVDTSKTQWQMIGFPFRDGKNIDQLRVVTTSGNCSTGCTLTGAAAEGLIANKLWHYDISAYQQLTNGGSSVLNPWDGAWIAILPAADGLSPKLLIPAAVNLAS